MGGRHLRQLYNFQTFSAKRQYMGVPGRTPARIGQHYGGYALRSEGSGPVAPVYENLQPRTTRWVGRAMPSSLMARGPRHWAAEADCRWQGG